MSIAAAIYRFLRARRATEEHTENLAAAARALHPFPGRLTDRVKYTGEPIIVEKQGRPFVAMIRAEDLERIERLLAAERQAGFSRLAAEAADEEQSSSPSDEEIVEAVRLTRVKPFTASAMAQPRLRVALDTNVLIAGIVWPRWPHEVVRAELARHFALVLPEQVVKGRRGTNPLIRRDGEKKRAGRGIVTDRDGRSAQLRELVVW